MLEKEEINACVLLRKHAIFALSSLSIFISVFIYSFIYLYVLFFCFFLLG